MILAISVSLGGCSRIARPKPRKSITIKPAASKRAGGCKIFYSICANDRHFKAVEMSFWAPVGWAHRRETKGSDQCLANGKRVSLGSSRVGGHFSVEEGDLDV